jgi:hypothetical protein
MAEITAFQPTAAGGAPTFAAAAAGDTAKVGDGYVLVVRNDDATSKTVTITVHGNLPTGVAYPDTPYTVEAGTEEWIPLPRLYSDPADGLADIVYSALTSVTRALVKF